MTIDILDDHREHIISEVICLKCLKRWIAARPIKTLLKKIECHTCGPGFVIETGENINE